jgi:TIR domain
LSHDVFVSYASQDKSIADAVTATLESRGIRCWIAPRDILPGVDWGEAIVDAIHDSHIMVLVFSGNANSSPQVKREVERAVSKGLPIIPFRIEAVPLSKSLEFFISSPHWLDAITPPMEKHLQYLCETIELLLSRQSAQPPSDAAPRKDFPSAPAAPKSRSSSSPLIALASVGVIVFVSAVVIVGWLIVSKRDRIGELLGLRKKPPETTITNVNTQTIPTVRNMKVVAEHNVQQQGHAGVLFHLDFELLDAQKGNCTVVITFYGQDRRTVIPAHDKTFTTADNHLACWRRFSPQDNDSIYKDLTVFMPYSEITNKKGKFFLSACAKIWYGRTPVSDCNWYDFWITG